MTIKRKWCRWLYTNLLNDQKDNFWKGYKLKAI